MRRFGPWANNRSFLRRRVTETLGLHYQMAWPNREFESGRGIRKSPLHDRLATAGSSFGSKAGWERPNWFAVTNAERGVRNVDVEGQFAIKPEIAYAWGRQNWFGDHA